MESAIERLRGFFSARKDVSFALLFGSRATGRVRGDSDWDIAVYFRGSGVGLDLEDPDRSFPTEEDLHGEVERIVGAPVDLVVLNRAPATVAASSLREGELLACPDGKTYGRFELAASLLAEEEREFARDYLRIKARSTSLSEADRDRLVRLVDFIETELADAETFAMIERSAYYGNAAFRRNLERWVENLVNASIDIAKILTASRRLPVPQTSREALLRLSVWPGFAKEDCDALATFSGLRNLLAHEYLDVRYPRLEEFVRSGPGLYMRLSENAKRILTEAAEGQPD